MTRRRPRVYAAHPMTTYHTVHAGERLAAIADHFPGFRVLDPSRLYRDDADWLERWPELVPTLSALVVFTDWTDCIGTGVLRELADVLYAGVPTFLLDDDLRLCELASLEVLDANERTPAAAVCPVAGEPAGDFLVAVREHANSRPKTAATNGKVQ